MYKYINHVILNILLELIIRCCLNSSENIECECCAHVYLSTVEGKVLDMVSEPI